MDERDEKITELRNRINNLHARMLILESEITIYRNIASISVAVVVLLLLYRFLS